MPFKLTSNVILAVAVFLVLGLSALYVLSEKPQTSKASNEYRSYSDSYEKLLNEKGAKEMYETFKADFSGNPLGQAHLTSHAIGALLYEKEGIEGVGICDSTFQFGCYHGLFAKAIELDGQEVVTKLDEECIEIFGADSASPCRHGIGHGLVEYYGHSRDQLDTALAGCNTGNENEANNPYFGCYTGVFMEYNHPILITETDAQLTNRKMENDDPFEPCSSLEDDYRIGCYFQIPQWWDKVYDHDYEKIGNLCDQIPYARHRDACFDGIGNVAAPHAEYNPKKIQELCGSIANREGAIRCFSTAAWAVRSEPNAGHDWRQVCSTLSEKEKAHCPTE